MNIWTIEGGQILVMETRTLTPLAIPWFHQFGRLRILNNLRYPLTNLFHVFEINPL